jgi:photosystem II stability/assembly factor-like uncharacterized protein
VVTALLAVPLLAPSASEGQTPPQTERDKQVAEIEKQIADLQKRIDTLKKSGQPTLPDGTIPDDWIKSLNWRCIGPGTMGGRITALAVYEADPSTYWVATASGGLLKTINNGVTFEHQFDREATVSIGDVAVAQSDRNIVWVGTGENNPRNSVSYGDGVYKSTDGGKTWKNMGLKKSFQIGRIAIHPKDPNVVYVGALGRLYGPSEERGLFKTTNGGETWEKVLYINDKTGIIDVAMNPNDPETLIVAAWERMRDGHDSWPGISAAVPEGYDGYDPIKKWGPGSGLYKTTDGGKTFKKLAKGLPTSELGRVGLDIYRKNPNVIFAVIDCASIAKGNPPGGTYAGLLGIDEKEGVKLTQVTENSPAAKAGVKEGDLVTAFDGKPVTTYATLFELIKGKKSGDKVKVAVTRGSEKKEIELALGATPSAGGGRTVVQPGFRGEDEGGGVRITSLTENGPAAKAGMKVDDLVVAADGKPIDSFRNFMMQMVQGGRSAGDKVKFTVQRGEEKRDFDVTLEALSFGGGGGTIGAFAGRGGFGRDMFSSAPRPYGAMYGGQAENVQDRQGPNGHELGGIYKSTDGGESWTRVNSLNHRPMYFSIIRVDPNDENYVYHGAVSMFMSTDGGKTFKNHGNNGLHPDIHALWINPKDGRHMVIGCDGGFYSTYDRMNHWDHLNHYAIGQFYHVAVCNKRPYWVYGGLQDNGSWGGPSHVFHANGPINEDWISVAGGDGFVMRVDPFDSDLVYYESQDGNMARRNIRTGESSSIRPREFGTQQRGFGGGPGFGGPGGPAGGQQSTFNWSVPALYGIWGVPVPAPTQDLLRRASEHRWNWNTPFVLSHHNPRIFYCAGNFVFRCLKRGDNPRQISPEITRTKRGSATALAESPRNSDVLWAGTDDGALWVTRDGGETWSDVTSRVGLPKPLWVSTIEASRFADGRAYVCFDGHRSDDDNPYLYVTEDYGQTWKPITSNLTWGSTRCLREDVQNPNLLYCGTEFAAWVSANRGQTWTKLNNNLPTVAIHEIAVHPTAGEIVAATHGRSVWVLDVTPLRQMTAEAIKANAFLYQPNTAVRWRSEPSRFSMYGNGSKRFMGQNAPAGAQIFYSLSKKPEKISLKIVDISGKTVRDLQARNSVGLHRISWDLSGTSPRGEGGPGGGGGRRGGGGGFAAMFGGGGGPAVAPGAYRVVLTVDGQELSQAVKVEADPTRSAGGIAEPEEDKDN